MCEVTLVILGSGIQVAGKVGTYLFTVTSSGLGLEIGAEKTGFGL